MAGQILFSFLPHLLYSQFFITPEYPITDCTGKTVIITGGNTGLGKEAARHFVRLNAAKVIISSRDLSKGEAAKKDIETSTGRSGVLELWHLDLQDYDSVMKFAERAKSLQRLDIVIENAGLNTSKFKMAAGHESTITVNVVSTYLLAFLLLPTLRALGEKNGITPTLTIVSSEVHFVAQVGSLKQMNCLMGGLRRRLQFPERKASSIFSTLDKEEKARMGDRYLVSKLLEVLASREIAREHPVDQLNVTFNLVNPGWCLSELTREMNGRLIGLIQQIMCRKTEVGSRTLVHAGLSGPETHGKYLSNCRIEECAPLVQGPEGPELQKRVWSELKDLLEEIQPGRTQL
jgi:retinol dehydrogenase 12